MKNLGVRERAREHQAGEQWFRTLAPHQKWLLGDAFVLGDFDWREWFDQRPTKPFMQGVEYARMLWESGET